MAFNKASGTVANLADLYAAVRDFIEAVAGWTVLKTGTDAANQNFEYRIFSSTGESTQETIRFGLTRWKHSIDRCGLQINGYTGYDSGLGFHDQPGGICSPATMTCCARAYVPGITVSDTNMAYWLFGDLDTVVVIVRVAAVYVAMYIGLLKRYALRTQDPYPMVVDSPATYIASSYLGTNDYTLCQVNFGWPSTNDGSLNYLYKDSGWQKAYRKLLNTESANSLMWLAKSNCFSRLPDNNRIVQPILIYETGAGVRGEFKHVYKIYGTALSAEDTITVGGNSYICFPDALDAGLERWIAVRNYV